MGLGRLLVAFFLLTVLAGCSRFAPVYSPTTPTPAVLSAHEGGDDVARATHVVKLAVLAGLEYKGYQVLEMDEGEIVARVDWGGHWAVVQVNYGATYWQIEHVQSSRGLRHRRAFDGGEIIHRRYNFWVHLLDEAIGRAMEHASLMPLPIAVAAPRPKPAPAPPTREPEPEPAVEVEKPAPPPRPKPAWL